MDPEQRRAAAAAACRAYVKRKTRFGRSLIATMALVCLGMSMVALDSAGLLVGGKHAIAQVLRVGPGECPERSTGCEDRTACIRFSADARDVRTNVSVPKPGPETGTRLEIVYRRGDPREASLPGSLQRDLVRGGVIAVLAALGALGGILWIRGARRRAARLHTLMLEGAPRPCANDGVRHMDGRCPRCHDRREPAREDLRPSEALAASARAADRRHDGRCLLRHRDR